MKTTKIIILIVIGIIAVVDFYLMFSGGREATISHVMIEWAYEYPIVPFCFGVLVGHLFWRMKDTDMTRRISGRK